MLLLPARWCVLKDPELLHLKTKLFCRLHLLFCLASLSWNQTINLGTKALVPRAGTYSESMGLNSAGVAGGALSSTYTRSDTSLRAQWTARPSRARKT